MGETWAPYLGNFECLAAPRSTNKGGEDVRFHSDRIMVIMRPLRRKGHRKRLKWSPTMYAGNIRTLLWEINQSRTGADKVEGWPKAGRLPPGCPLPPKDQRSQMENVSRSPEPGKFAVSNGYLA